MSLSWSDARPYPSELVEGHNFPPSNATQLQSQSYYELVPFETEGVAHPDGKQASHSVTQSISSPTITPKRRVPPPRAPGTAL